MNFPPIHALIEELTSRGVTLTLADGTLTVDAPAGVLTPGLVEILKARKPELIAVLSGRPVLAGRGLFYLPGGGVALAERPSLSATDLEVLAMLDQFDDPATAWGVWRQYRQTVEAHPEGPDRDAVSRKACAAIAATCVVARATE